MVILPLRTVYMIKLSRQALYDKGFVFICHMMNVSGVDPLYMAMAKSIHLLLRLQKTSAIWKSAQQKHAGMNHQIAAA
jgi:hypothetical protein